MTNERMDELMALADRCTAIARRTGEPTAMAVRGNGAGTSDVSARWHTAVDAALLQTRGNKPRAVAMVVRKHPALRAQLIQQANANRKQPIAQAAPKPTARANPTADFKQKVQQLMDGGLSKLEAAKLLSKQMGLSGEQQGTRFVSTRGDYR